jgi:hypothetical protein
MRVKEFSLTKEDKSVSRYEAEVGVGVGVDCGSHRNLVRPSPAFLAFCRPTTKKQKKKIQEAMDMFRCCYAIKLILIIKSPLKSRLGWRGNLKDSTK